MLEVRHSSIDRIAVHVNVEGRHEDGNLNGFTLEEFIFKNLPHNNNLAVSRRDDKIPSLRCCPVRVTEKIQREEEKSKQNADETKLEGLQFNQIPTQQTADDDNCGNGEKDIIAIFCDQQQNSLGK